LILYCVPMVLDTVQVGEKITESFLYQLMTERHGKPVILWLMCTIIIKIETL